ncbi:hypothetical protein H5410_036579 [Solanum commersonii]|uniref:Uncharacterized protein n=1 Tax=Solanum commersonii TaxID=4109 RepID=A0A9J5Y3Y3_SOLCO|nr:hypothetical protein H5410_036579 [Solanum commersonii]
MPLNRLQPSHMLDIWPQIQLKSPKDKPNSKFKLQILSTMLTSLQRLETRKLAQLPTHVRGTREQPSAFGAKITLQLPNLTPSHVPAMCIGPASPSLPLGCNLLNCCSCPALSLQLV